MKNKPDIRVFKDIIDKGAISSQRERAKSIVDGYDYIVDFYGNIPSELPDGDHFVSMCLFNDMVIIASTKNIYKIVEGKIVKFDFYEAAGEVVTDG